MLEVDNRVILPEIKSWSLFKEIHCSSSSKATAAFKDKEVVIEPKIATFSVDSHPIPNPDLTELDKLLLQLKNNMNSLSDMQITQLKSKIQASLEQLRDTTKNSFVTFGKDFVGLTNVFYQLNRMEEFKDLSPIINKVGEFWNKDIPKPNDALLESDPIKYWKGRINHANQSHADFNRLLKLFKDYIKDNGLLSTEDKTHLFTNIKNLNKSLASIVDADKIIFKQNIETSKTLIELQSIRTK